MNFQNMTQKSAEAIRAGQNIAAEHANQDMREEHLLLALLSLVAPMIKIKRIKPIKIVKTRD